MNITPDPVFRDKLLEEIRTREFSDRAGEIHESDLNYCLNKSYLRRVHPIKESDNTILHFSLGWSTQRWLTGRGEEKPVVKDGIVVTSDDFRDGMPWELKATYTSSKRDPMENRAWVRQIMAECYVKGVTSARLSRLELMGDYDRKANNKPTLSVWRLDFMEEELKANWAWFQMRRALFEEMQDTKELLPKALALASGDDEYECGYCAYLGKECVV